MDIKLNGLSCAHCASVIEDKVAGLEGISQVQLNFTSQTLRFKSSEKQDESAFRDEIIRLIGEVEPDVSCEVRGEGSGNAEKKTFNPASRAFRLPLSLLLFSSALFLPAGSVFLLLTAYALSGYDVLLKALGNLGRKNVFDEHLLMTLATAGALYLGEFHEAAAVMIFYQAGEFFQNLAVSRSRKSLEELLDLKAVTARVETPEGFEEIDPSEVEPGDVLIVRPGERIPLDGEVLSGHSFIDTSSLTGESRPFSVGEGMPVYSGSINIDGLLRIRAVKSFEDSSLSVILALVEESSSRKAKTELFIRRFARIYTPAVVLLALLLATLPPLFIPGQVFRVWFYRSLIFLVVSCPCALMLSIPLTYFSGIGLASSRGILVKGGQFLDVLANVRTGFLDKTGTLTHGEFELESVHLSGILSESVLMQRALDAEVHSNHPLARSVAGYMEGKGYLPAKALSVREISGMGLEVETPEARILAGNRALMNLYNVEISEEPSSSTSVYIALDSRHAGTLYFRDKLKDSAAGMVKELRSLGFEKLVLLTGDSQEAAESVHRAAGTDEFLCDLRPENKRDILRNYKASNRYPVLFLGDGLNDAPVLAESDAGVSLGNLGSDLAVESADIILMDDDLAKLPLAVKIARKTRTLVWQNLLLIFIAKGLVLVLGAAGFASMWHGVLADVGVALLAVLNSSRLLLKNRF